MTKLLFTPGPLTTTPTVKEAMLLDWGSRDPEFISLVRDIRRRLVGLAGGTEPDWQAIPMQGSGTFGIESVIGSAVPRDGALLVFINGAYGRRMARIAEVLGIRLVPVFVPENKPITASVVAQALAANRGVTHAATVHCETTTGLLNPIGELVPLIARAGCRSIIDAMSSFGGVALDAPRCEIDFLVSSSNKCIQGVPGFSFVIARKEALEECRDRARSLSLDLHAQWLGLESNGQFRFTPPTHALAAFRQALDELDAEGGVPGRARRYAANHETLIAGMARLGIEPYLAPGYRGHTITSFRYPQHPAFSFPTFYDLLSERGFIIYPGKLSQEDCFRVGTIGDLSAPHFESLVAAVGEVLSSMGASSPVSANT